jgi:hypothetical protein
MDFTNLISMLGGGDQPKSILETSRGPDPSSGMDTETMANFLAMMGKGIDPKGFGGIVGEDVQGQVRTNKFANLLKKNQGNDDIAKLIAMALGGGGKVNIDPEKTTVNLPHEALPDSPTTPKGNTLADLLGGISKGGGIDTSPFLSGPRESGLNFDKSDLVGLRPEDISAVLQFKKAAEKEPIDAMKDVIGMKYQMGLIDNMEADNQLAFYNAITKETRTETQKNFDAARKEGYTGTFVDFLENAKNDSINDYKFAVSQGYNGKYKEWVTEMKKAGAFHLSIGEKTAEAVSKEIGVTTAKRMLELEDPNTIAKMEKDAMQALEVGDKENKRKFSPSVEQLAKMTPEEKKVVQFNALPIGVRAKYNAAQSYDNAIKKELGDKNVYWDTSVPGVNRWYDVSNPKQPKLLMRQNYGK